MEMLSRENTQALRGFAALGIIAFHLMIEYHVPVVFNVVGAFFVTLFVLLSGFGLEESFRVSGLDDFWRKRFRKLVLPFVFFVLSYNLLFYRFLSQCGLASGGVLHKCLDELLFLTPTFWFVFFILKCYVVYWIGARFMSNRLRLSFYLVCAFACLNMPSVSGHLEAEQSFCFVAGVLLSMYKDRVNSLSASDVRRWVFLLFAVGAVFLYLKSFTPLHTLKGSVAYNYLLCPIRLSVGLALIPVLTMLRVSKGPLLQTAGKYSLELYIAHIPFVALIASSVGTAVFFACSVLAFFILLIYRRFIADRLSVPEVLFVIINVLFVAKYSARVCGDAALYVSLFATVFYCFLLSCLRNEIGTVCRRIALSLCLLAFVGMVVLQYAIDPYSLQVDRWSALHFPIQNLLDGVCPYIANTHLGGNASPFPVWQLLHVPFYLIGNVGLSFFVAVAMFFWSCHKTCGSRKALTISMLLFSSVAVWYEAAVRSDLMTNMLLVATIINLIFPRLSQEWVESRRWWIAAAVGLLASTRMIALVPLTVLLLPYFVKMKWRSQIGVALLSAGVFSMTFVPLSIWDWQQIYHFQNNPWALQTSQGHFSDFVFFVPLAVFLAMTHNGNARQCNSSIALMLAMLVGVTFAHNMYAGENWDVFSSTYDITYFSTALPFCFLAIGQKERPREGKC